MQIEVICVLVLRTIWNLVCSDCSRNFCTGPVDLLPDTQQEKIWIYLMIGGIVYGIKI